MLSEAKLFVKKLDEVGFHHDGIKETDRSYAIQLAMKGDNTKFKIYCLFDKDGHTVALRCGDFISASEDKYANVLLCCNKLNQEYRWVKFIVDDDNDINIEDDAIVDGTTAGEEIFELIMRMANIVDDAYPVFMKAIWS